VVLAADAQELDVKANGLAAPVVLAFDEVSVARFPSVVVGDGQVGFRVACSVKAGDLVHLVSGSAGLVE
jgi:hypothetical protein